MHYYPDSFTDNFSYNEVIIASLLHDIGHIIGMEANEQLEMEGCGITNHETVGGSFVNKLGFSDRVSKLISSHVSAKRYLCFKNPEYYNNLTDASKTTLKYQGKSNFIL